MKFQIYTLGCKVNTYESNVMRDALLNKGYFEVGLKVQNKKEEESKIDGVDIVIGNINKSKIVDYIEKYIEEKKQEVDVRNIMDTNFEPMMLNNFNKTRAFVKIQDGCNNFCSYCIIPYTRGNVRSKDKQSVLKEIQLLVDEGHKEVVLTGIHTGNYGAEFADYKFADLLKDIVKIDKLERLRISSIEITEINDDVMEVIKENNILVDHMHIPLQSGSDAVLKRMNRKYDKEYFINKIKKLRKIRPNISITTDVIVGFPGETKEEFEETIETIKKIEFTKLHVFPYSKREGTKAAIMDGQVDENIKKKRVKILLQLSKELEYNYMEKFIGKKVIFIPEMAKEEYIIGHTGNFLNVKYRGNKNDLNKDIEVKINNIEYPYCIGSTID